MAVRDDDRLHAELDRQLSEVRAACDGLATRSGLLLAAISAIALLLGPRIDPAHHLIVLVLALVAFGLAAVGAGVTLMPWLKLGPEFESLVRWQSAGATPTTSSELYASKSSILDANRTRLVIMRVSFMAQAVATVVAIGVALVYTALR